MTSAQATLLIGAAILIVDISIRIFAVAAVSSSRRPQTALAWLVGIFFLPYIGLPLFFLAGTARLPASRRKKQEQVDVLIRPEDLELVATATATATAGADLDVDAGGAVRATVVSGEFLGATSTSVLELGDASVVQVRHVGGDDLALSPGSPVLVRRRASLGAAWWSAVV